MAGSCDGRRDEVDEARNQQIAQLVAACALSTAIRKLVISHAGLSVEGKELGMSIAGYEIDERRSHRRSEQATVH